MSSMSSVKKICVSAVCVALCCILPQAFHALALGTALSPMHLPVLLCGLVCGWPYGLVCGLLGPLLSHLLTGMPPAAALLHMVPELCVYGAASGLLMGLIRTGRTLADVYCALIPAMLLGRVAGGIAQAVVYLSAAKSYSVALWATAYLAGTAPGMVLHLIAVPALVLVLERAGLIPMRYRAPAAA